MMSRIRGRLTFANVTSLLALFVALGAGSYAIGSIPGKDGKITACYQKRTGVLRVVDADKKQKCPKGHRRLAWNQQGIQGTAGAPGQPGQPGQPGAPGAPGISGLQVVRAFSGPDSNSKKTQTAYCPEGKRAIGSGAAVVGQAISGSEPNQVANVVITQVAPSLHDVVPGSVFAEAAERPATSDVWELDVYAICANVQ
jgi:hypothetical protein